MGFAALALLSVALCAVMGWRASVAYSRWTLARAALPELEEAARRDPYDAVTAHYLGKRLYEAGRSQEGNQALMRAASLAPDEEEIWLDWAQCAGHAEGNQAAFTVLTAFLKGHPQNAAAHLAMGRLAAQLGNTRRAYEEASTAARLDARNPEAWRLVGLMALAYAPNEAENAARQAVRLAPDDWRNQAAMGDVQLAGRRDDAARQYYEAAIRLAPEQALNHCSLGKTLLRQAKSPEQVEAAQRELLKAVALQPDVSGGYLSLGRSYARQEKWADAAAALEKAERLSPNDAQIPYELSRALQQSGNAADSAQALARHDSVQKYQAAKLVLQEGLARHRTDARRRLELARLCALHHEDEEAAWNYLQIPRGTEFSAVAGQELGELRRRSAHK